jgi:hypothetical protein
MIIINDVIYKINYPQQGQAGSKTVHAGKHDREKWKGSYF